MNLTDIKDSVIDRLRPLIERVQESSLYLKLKERYENLSPKKQKIVHIVAAVLGLLILLSYPMGYLSTSGDYLTEYNDSRDLTRKLFKVVKNTKGKPALPTPPGALQIKGTIDQELKNLKILPEQIASVSDDSGTSEIVPKNLISYIINVQLKKINLKQVIDVGYKLQNLNPAIKLEDLSMIADREGYFDFKARLVALNVPELDSVLPDMDELTHKDKKSDSTKDSLKKEPPKRNRFLKDSKGDDND